MFSLTGKTALVTGGGSGMTQEPPRWLRPGDHVMGEIKGIGRLHNPITEEAR